MCNNESEKMGARIREIPEDIEWPRYDDGELVDVGDLLRQGMVVGVEMRTEGYHIECLRGSVEGPYGACVIRPALAADGEIVEAGDTVWNAATGEEYWVVDVCGGYVYLGKSGSCHVSLKLLAGALTHVRPVLDADGAPLKAGQTVWIEKDGDGPYVINANGIRSPSDFVDCHYEGNENERLHIRADLITGRPPVRDANDVLIRPGDVVYTNATSRGDGTAWRVVRLDPKRAHSVHAEREHGRAVRRDLVPAWLTHEPDTWERIERDAKTIDQLIDSEWGGDPKDARNLVRRCKRLAERGR